MRDFKTFFYNKLKFASNIYISFRDRRSIWLALPGNVIDALLTENYKYDKNH